MSAQSPTFNRYMYKSFILWVSGMVFGLGFVIFLSNLVENLRRTADVPNIGTGHIIRLSAYELPVLLVEVAPILVFFAAVGCLWWRTRSHELIVARAAGLSVWQIVKPLTLTALITGAFFSGVVHPLAERAGREHAKLEEQFFKRAAPKLRISSTGFWLKETVAEDAYRLIRSKKVALSQGGATLSGVELYRIRDSSEIKRHLTAKQGRITDGTLELKGVLDHADPNNPVPVSDRALSSAISLADVRVKQNTLQSRHFWALPEGSKDKSLSIRQSLDLKLRYQKLLALPFNLMGLVLLAAIFSLRMSRKGSVGVLIITGVILALGLHFLGDVLYSLGLSGRLWTVIAVWALPATVWLFSAALLLNREDG